MYQKYFGLVLDIETLSADKIRNGGPVVTELAAVPFFCTENKLIHGEVYSSIINVPKQIEKGLHVDPDTVRWHISRGGQAADLLNQDGLDLAEAVDQFLAWARKNLNPKATVYAWGSDFDAPMLHRAYTAYTGNTNTSDSFYPWRFGNYRCARTLFYELTQGNYRPSEKPHTAAKDVIVELKDIVFAWNNVSKSEFELEIVEEAQMNQT
jgi:hypothetical protein